MFILYIHTRIAKKRLLSWENESAQLGKSFFLTGKKIFAVKCSMLVNIYARLSFYVKLG